MAFARLVAEVRFWPAFRNSCAIDGGILGIYRVIRVLCKCPTKAEQNSQFSRWVPPSVCTNSGCRSVLCISALSLLRGEDRVYTLKTESLISFVVRLTVG